MNFGSETMRRRVRFERNASRIVFDPVSSSFVVTWSKCNAPQAERARRIIDPSKRVPSISAMATLFDRGRITEDQVVPAAKAVGRAWDLGDREFLDTEEAKKSAEFVRNISTMCADSDRESVSCDFCQAMRHLVDEIANVRFSCFEIPEDCGRMIGSIVSAAEECLLIDGFLTWDAANRRRRFLFCLDRRECSELVYSVVSLLFDTGACPLLSVQDRRALRIIGLEKSDVVSDFRSDTVRAFCAFVIEQFRTMKAEGRNTLGAKITQQQLIDYVNQQETNKKE